MPRTKSPASTNMKRTWTISNPKHYSPIASGLMMVSIFVVCSLSCTFQNACFSLELVLLLAVSVSHEMWCQPDLDLRKNATFCTGISWLPVTCHVNTRMYAQTDKHKYNDSFKRYYGIGCHLCLHVVQNTVYSQKIWWEVK